MGQRTKVHILGRFARRLLAKNKFPVKGFGAARFPEHRLRDGRMVSMVFVGRHGLNRRVGSGGNHDTASAVTVNSAIVWPAWCSVRTCWAFTVAPSSG